MHTHTEQVAGCSCQLAIYPNAMSDRARALRVPDTGMSYNAQDNTLTAPYADGPHPLVEEGLRRCREVFAGRMCIMSNSAGTR